MTTVYSLLKSLNEFKSDVAVSMLSGLDGTVSTRGGSSSIGPRVYFYPSQSLYLLEEKMVRAFNDAEAVYPEDIALYALLRDTFWLNRVDRPEDADYVFAPIPTTTARFVPKEELALGLAEMPLLGKIPHLLIDSNDAYSRPGYEKGNASRESLVDIKREFFSWVNPDFQLLYLDSTFNDHPNDIPILPFCGFERHSPEQTVRPLLTGFVGTLGVENWPKGNIRGIDRLPDWMAVKEQFDRNAFIGSSMEAIFTQNGVTVPYRELPRRARTWLCPRGFSAYTYRISEAVLSGAMPWILADDYRLPFASRIDWEQFTLRSAESKLGSVHSEYFRMTSTIEKKIQALAGFQECFTPQGLARLTLLELKETALREK